MRAIKSKDTLPELLVRRLVHGMGYRYRLHRKDLPGKPDLAFPRMRKAIFVHGCFWHRHDCDGEGRVPERNRAYWREKLERNKERDLAAVKSLRDLGWKVGVFWECELREQKTLARRLRLFLGENARKKLMAGSPWKGEKPGDDGQG
jgi:DNA mismatch endonuclease (patch repair protein)